MRITSAPHWASSFAAKATAVPEAISDDPDALERRGRG